MQAKSEHLPFSKTKLWAAIRLVSVSILFMAGIICSVASTEKLLGIYDSEEVKRKRSLENLIQAQMITIAHWEQQIKYANKELAATDDKEEKVLIAARITKYKESLASAQAVQERQLKELQELRAKAQKEASCFPADMLVLTTNGAKSIGDIKVGDRVLSVDAAGQQVASDVLKTYADRNNHYYLINGKIKVTAFHRFLTDAGWKRARELEVGDRMQTAGGSYEEIATLERFTVELDVYNLTITSNHNFFISADGKNGYLVHNTSGGGSK